MISNMIATPHRVVRLAALALGLAALPLSAHGQAPHAKGPRKPAVQRGAVPLRQRAAPAVKRLQPQARAIVRPARIIRQPRSRDQHLLEAIKHLEAIGELTTARSLREKLTPARRRPTEYGSIVQVDPKCIPEGLSVTATVSHPSDERVSGMWMKIYENTSDPVPPQHPPGAEMVDVSGGGNTFTHEMTYVSDDMNHKVAVWAEFAYETNAQKEFNCPAMPDPIP